MRLHHLFFSLPFLLVQPCFADSVLEQAQTLLNAKKYIQAYDLLSPLEEERSGQPDFEYLYGLALLEAGETNRAAFAFDRCLGTDPNNGPCRMQMARTHLALGEIASGRKELAIIKDYNPPPEIQQLVAQYLGIAQKIEVAQTHQVRHYLKISAGHDTNVNGATENAHIALPSVKNIPIFLIVPHRQSSAFTHIDIGSSLYHKLSPDLLATLEGNIDYRAIFNNPEFSYYTANAAAGLLTNVGNTAIQGKLQWQTMGLDGSNYRDMLGIMAQIQHPLPSDAQVSAFTQFNQLRYDSQGARDADRSTLGLAYSQAFNAAFSPSFYASLYQGQESTTNSQFDYFSHTFTGLRLGGDLHYSAAISINAHASLEQRDYEAANPFLPFNSIRQDDETQFGLGLTWHLNAKYSLQPYYNYSHNNANQVINNYTRHVFGLDLRIAL